MFCPDAARFGPPAGDHALVAMVPRPDQLLDPAARDALIPVLAEWARHDALFTVPTATGAATLRVALPVAAERVRVVPLPLPPARVLAPPDAPGSDILAVDPGALDWLLSATSLLRASGFEQRLLLCSPEAERVAQPGGGGAAVHGLLPGHDVIAVPRWRESLRSAGVVVLGPHDLGMGWILREALATGRPVVVPSSAWVRDHLAAVGADAYLYGNHQSLVTALRGALRRQRGGALEAAARDAVLAESWQLSAAALLGALVEALTPAAPSTGTPSAGAGRPTPAVRVRDRLRVCVMNPNANGGGGETFMRQLAVAMARHASAPDITLICQLRPGAPFDPRTDTLTKAGVQVQIVHGEDVTGIAPTEGPAADVVYYAWSHASDPPATEVPLICTIHDVNWKHFDIYGPRDRAMIERQVPAWLERAAAVTHSSEFIRDEVRRYYGTATGMTRVIPLAADPPSSQTNDEERDDLRRRFGLPERFLLSPNGAHRNKNYPALECALRALRRDGRPVPVIATGMGTEFFHGPDLIGLGYLKAREVQALYELSDGIVQTTLYEAGSFPLFEAMALGKPVAISRIPPIVEQLERTGGVAELFDPLDPADVARAIWRLWARSPTADPGALVANARAAAARTWDDVAGDYLKLFSEVRR